MLAKIIRTLVFSPAKKMVLSQLFIYFAVVCQTTSYDFKSVFYFKFSQRKGAEVCFCGGCPLKLNYYNLNSSDTDD